MDKRVSLTICLLRPLLIAAICLVHVPFIAGYSASIVDSAHFSTLLGPFVMDTFARSAVPLLTVISGLLALSSCSKSSYPGYVGHKALRLLLPFVLWNVLLAGAFYLSYSYLQYPQAGAKLLQYHGWGWVSHVLGLQHFPVNGPLYFLRDLFVVSLLTPLFALLARHQLIAGMTALGLMALFIYYPQLEIAGYYWLFRSDLLFFFFLGVWAGHEKFSDNMATTGKPAGVWVLLAVVLVCIGVTWFLVVYKPAIMTYARFKPFLGVAFLFTLPAIVAAVGRYQQSRPVAWLKAASPYSFTLFLVHYPVAILYSYILEALSLAPNNTSAITWQLVMMLGFLILAGLIAWLTRQLYWQILVNVRVFFGRNKQA